MAATIRLPPTSGGGDNPTTVVVSKPSGLAAGDYLLAFQVADADGALATMTAPSGFTALTTQAPTSGTNIPAGKVWGKVATASDVSASTFSFPDGTGSHCSVVLMAIQAGTYSTATPTSGYSWATQGSAGNSTISHPGIIGANDAVLLVAYMPDTGGVVRTFSGTPSGMSLLHQSTAGGATYTRCGVYQQVLTSGAATGAKNATLSGTPSGWIAVALLVNPGATAPTVDAGADVASHYANTEFARTAGETGTGITSRAWTINSGPAGVGTTIGTAAALAWTPTTTGTYVLRYSATNPSGTGTDDMSITVVAQTAPTVSAGADVGSHTVSTAFARTATESANGSAITSRAWTIQAGPAGVGTTIGTAAALSWTPTTLGTYTLRYAATNGIGTGTDDVAVTVTSGPPPTVGAGLDVTSHPVDTEFARTATESGSGITAREWKVQAGPYYVDTVLSTTTALSWFPNQPGTYTLRFSATNSGGVGTDDMTITVVNPPATPGEILNIGVGAGKNHYSVDIGRAANRELIETSQIEAGYEDAPYFTGTTDYSRCAFWTRVDATTTSGSQYARCELRETEPGGDVEMAFNPHDGGTHWQRGRSAYTHLPPVKPEIVTAQLHSGDGDVIQIRTQLVSGRLTHVLRVNGTGVGIPRFEDPYVAGSEFDWAMEILPPLNGQPAKCRVYYNSLLVPHWTFNVADMPVTAGVSTYFYKAGNYLQSNETTETDPTEFGSTTLRNLQHWHTGWATPDNGFWGLPDVDAGPDFSTPAGWAISRTGNDGALDADRVWYVVDGPTGGTNVGQTVSTTATLNWAPAVQGTYRLRYGVTTEIGTNIDDALVTVTAPVSAGGGFLPFFNA